MKAIDDDAGFSLVEQIIAMVVIAGALLGLLSTLGATAHGVTVSRQRTIAVSLGKQVIEHLQGVAYTSVAMNLASVAGEPLLTGVAPKYFFEGEPVVPGGIEPYRTTTSSVGTTFVIRTFVTSVAAESGDYRRATVIIDWPATKPAHTVRFSSLVFPLDYASYPATSGSAEALGGIVTVTGTLGGDSLDDVRVQLPGARADTQASTLRTAIAAAASAASHVTVASGPLASLSCEGAGASTGECARQTLESVADNDSTSSAGSSSSTVGQGFTAGGLDTPAGTSFVTPAGTMNARAKTDACGSCGFGDNDAVPWAETSVVTTSATGATFTSDHGAGALSGSLWNLQSGWAPSALIDQDDVHGSEQVAATAQLSAPAVTIMALTGAPAGFEGAVLVDPFVARAATVAGYSMTPPDLSTATTPRRVRLWNGAGYQLVTVDHGVAVDVTVTGSVTVGDHVVTFQSRVQSQASTFSAVGTAPRTDAAAQHPSVLVITVDVTITSATLTVPTTTTTTSTSTSTTSTTAPPVPLVTDQFSIVFDYGRVSAHDTWLAKAP